MNGKKYITHLLMLLFKGELADIDQTNNLFFYPSLTFCNRERHR